MTDTMPAFTELREAQERLSDLLRGDLRGAASHEALREFSALATGTAPALLAAYDAQAAEIARLTAVIDKLLAHCDDPECATCGESVCPPRRAVPLSSRRLPRMRRRTGAEMTDTTQPDALPWEKCREHGPAKPRVWACPACLVELRAECESLRTQLAEARESMEFRAERAAQRERRLWQWAHEELGEPLKTRYFNIVANGTADVMEQPIYAQQFNMMKRRAESAEEKLAEARADADECEQLRTRMADLLSRTAVAIRGPEPDLTLWGWDDLPERAAAAMTAMAGALQAVRNTVAEAEALRAEAARYRWLRDDLESDWAICEWIHDDPEGIGYYRDGRAAHIVDAAIDAAIAAKGE